MKSGLSKSINGKGQPDIIKIRLKTLHMRIVGQLGSILNITKTGFFLFFMSSDKWKVSTKKKHLDQKIAVAPFALPASITFC